MSVCECCWKVAASRAHADTSKTQTEHYSEIIIEHAREHAGAAMIEAWNALAIAADRLDNGNEIDRIVAKRARSWCETYPKEATK